MAQPIKGKKRADLSTLQIREPASPEPPVEPVKLQTQRAFSGWPMIIAWVGMLVFAIHACTHMVAAGDTWVAMACGRHFVNRGQTDKCIWPFRVDTNEPFSANSHRVGPTPEEIKTWPKWAQRLTDIVGLETVKYWHPTGWVNQNWLTHVIFYLLVPKSSYADGLSFTSNALVYWKIAIYILTVLCVYYTAINLGVNPGLSAVFSCFAMFIGRSFLDIRPAGFSNLFVAVFLLILVLTTYRNVLYIWLLVPLAVFWCNVHGGYIYAFIMLLPFIGLHLLIACNKKLTAILYNVIAWPFFFYLLVSKTKAAGSKGPGLESAEMITIFLLPVLLIAMDVLLIFFKKNLVSIGWKGVLHTIAAGIAAFVATVVFNPFHLTNLTHTYVISVSPYAERWRDVHEWHPAFAWDNPVGTSFPFLVLHILGIGLLVLWVLARFMRPRFLKAPKSELEAQKRLFTILSNIFAGGAALLLGWVTFISFSLLNLDKASFLFCTVFIGVVLLSVRKSVHFIYLLVPLTFLALYSANANAGYQGRYIYPFVTVPAYVIACILTWLFAKNVRIKQKDIIFPLAASVVSVFLMIVRFNPFKFQPCSWNLIEYLKQFLYIRRLWVPEYERNLELAYEYLFVSLYILNIASVIIWFAFPYLRRLFGRLPSKITEEAQRETYQWPKIDLPLLLIAALTIYMAILSRRFIPIAAIAACPVIAMFIDQIIRSVSASLNFHKYNSISVSPMSKNLRLAFTYAGVVAVLSIGIGWTLTFKRVYLDPWPADPNLTSVFIRMSASDAKPFCACKFIKDNKLKGNMFNYWTEGGFISFGQEPDPNTGHIGLKLFMDGRAQAAYNVDTFNLWTTIMSGGPIVQSAQLRGHTLTGDDYKKIGEWTDQLLKRYKVWVVLMPAAQFDTAFAKGLEYHPGWRLVLVNNKDRLFVDYTTPQGKDLFEGIFAGKTLFPDEFCKNLTFAHNLLMLGKGVQAKQEGLDFAIKAYDINPSPAPMLEIVLIAARFNELKPRIDDFCKQVVEDFAKNHERYAKQHGYRLRIEAVRLACYNMENIARAQNNTASLNFYTSERSRCESERARISDEQRW